MSLIVIAQNITNLSAVSDYKYQVLVGDGTPARSTILAEGKVTGHPRLEGWQALLQRILDANPAK